ncbi:MAG: hypothetical protein WED07_05730 [Candidatus Freyarchaeum deiterrae]
MAAAWDSFVITEAYNWARDPNFGFREVEYFHDPLTPPMNAYPSYYDTQPYVTPYYIRVDNWYYKLPWPYSVNVDNYSQLWNEYTNLVTVWGNTIGFDTWVWVGPFPTNSPPP